ncbi:DUF11 domain-containing protein [Streptomyces sp. NPDC087440]|uniref:DUF11 domain-containing protein n=1 Tax=Streptomyces sp. NPDC087440 TaxID=3365790 RepID=UPI00381BB3D2
MALALCTGFSAFPLTTADAAAVAESRGDRAAEGIAYSASGGPRTGSVRAIPPGQPFTYTLSAKNNGPSTARNVKSTDTLPANIEFVSSADGCTAAGQVVTCGPEPTLAVGATKTWTFTARIKPSYTGDGSDLGNVTTGSSDAGDPDPGNDGTDPVKPPGPFTPQADITTQKAHVAPGPVAPGQEFDYRITASNAGPSDARQVSATDALPAGLTFVSSADGCTAAGQNVTCGVEPAVASGGTKEWRFRVKLDPSYAGDGSDLTNVATATSVTQDPNPANNPSTAAPAPTIGRPNADLATTKAPTTTAKISAGETFDYAIRVVNNGPSAALNVKASDPLPAALSFVSSADGCTASGSTVTCGPQASLAPGAAKVWTFKVKLDPDYLGDGSDVRNVATASSDTDDSDPGNNSNTPAGLPGGSPAAPKADIESGKTAS